MFPMFKGLVRENPEKKKHSLNIMSLHDAQASCACGGWHFSRTGHATEKEIKKEYRRHIISVIRAGAMPFMFIGF